jgi:hypothetical protein
VDDANAVGNRRHGRDRRACNGLQKPRQAHQSDAVVDKGTPNDDLLVPDLPTSITEGDVGFGGAAGTVSAAGRHAGRNEVVATADDTTETMTVCPTSNASRECRSPWAGLDADRERVPNLFCLAADHALAVQITGPG